MTTSEKSLVYVINNLRAGGAERHLSRLAPALSERGWKLSVYCLGGGGRYAEVLREAGIPVVFEERAWSNSVGKAAGSLIRLVKYLRCSSPSIVHCYLQRAGFVGAIAARLARTPIVITTRRGVELHDSSRVHRVAHRMMNKIADLLSDTIVAVSDSARSTAIAEGTPTHKIVTVRNGIRLRSDPPLKTPTFDGSPVIGSVGTLHTIKGHRYLLRSAQVVLRDCPRALFVLVGDGPERSALESLAAHLRIADRTIFLGEREDVPQLLRAFDIFVLPSLGEGMPNTILEAMAANVPVVASRVGGVPEIIVDGVTGLLVPPASPQDLATAVLRLAGSPVLRAEVAKRAFQTVSGSFSEEREVRDTEMIYENFLARADRL